MFILMDSLLALSLVDPARMQALLEQFFYPGLLGVLIIASLGIPIPEDLPLIGAGVVLKLHPEYGSFPLTVLFGFLGVMSGDTVLYTMGRLWGRGVVKHKSVNWIVTPSRFERAERSFHRWGGWFCFFGRLIVGVRAVMCLVAGATRYPFWRFLVADGAGAMVSVPLFVGIGYLCAGTLAHLVGQVAEVQGVAAAVVGIAVMGFVLYEVRKIRRARRESAEALKVEAAATKERDFVEAARPGSGDRVRPLPPVKVGFGTPQK